MKILLVLGITAGVGYGAYRLVKSIGSSIRLEPSTVRGWGW